MNEMLFSHNQITEYSDYRNFINFIENKSRLVLKNINPFEYFRLDNADSITDSRLYVSKFFKGRFNKLPTFKMDADGFNKYKLFEDFTSKDEVHNISLWAISCLKYLSFTEETRLGKELEIIQANNPRDGRLDAVVLTKNQIVVLESKVSLTSLLSEGRYKYQIPSYLLEGIKIVEEYNTKNSNNYEFTIFLLIGGDETDLYPPEHPDCITGQVGDISKIFYDSLMKYNIKFISANALWALAAVSDVLNKKLYWYELLPDLYKEKDVIGLLSGGIVVIKDGAPVVEPLNL